MSDDVTRSALVYHGAKFRIAPWVLQHFPPHLVYVEPFGGAAGVLLQKPRSDGEVYNDLDGDVVNFFRVLRDSTSRNSLIEQLTLTPFARTEWELACKSITADPIERARRLCIRAQMGFGSAGATKQSNNGFRRNSNNHKITSWVNYPESLNPIGKRFSGVLIENRPAIDVMRFHDSPDTLHYVDPPYMASTRSGNYYRHEMTDADHGELIEVLQGLTGMVVLSGYDNPIYSSTFKHWPSFNLQATIAANRGGAFRTETLWLNPACHRALDPAQGELCLGSR